MSPQRGLFGHRQTATEPGQAAFGLTWAFARLPHLPARDRIPSSGSTRPTRDTGWNTHPTPHRTLRVKHGPLSPTRSKVVSRLCPNRHRLRTWSLLSLPACAEVIRLLPRTRAASHTLYTRRIDIGRSPEKFPKEFSRTSWPYITGQCRWRAGRIVQPGPALPGR
jgi:hypothetical protein